MSHISIGVGGTRTEEASSWRRYGLQENPFPRSGVATNVDYDDHQQSQIQDVNSWLTRTVAAQTKQWSPLAISGSIGVGKTHVLRRMERAIRDFRDAAHADEPVMVSYLPLTASGMKSLQLSNLLLETIAQQLPGDSRPSVPGEVPLLTAIAKAIRARKGASALKSLPTPSPLSRPLESIIEASSSDEATRLTSLTASWLMRRNLGRSDQEAIGVAGRLEAEGQAVRAFSHLCKIAHQLGRLRVWVLLVDQFEDLWRRDVTTALRRTRFLTDLRTLVDESLEGAPVAVTLAWNTEMVIGGARVDEDVETKLKQDYVALFTRIRDVIRIPLLPLDHALPFANAYIDSAYAQQSGNTVSKKDRLNSQLNKDFQSVLAMIDPIGKRQGGSLVARSWLDALRTWAEKLVAAE